MKKIDWSFCQNNSDEILMDGLLQLEQTKAISFSKINESQPGNYLICLETHPFYIGEAQNIVERMKQQFKPKISTFYKNYLSKQKSDLKSIDEFSVKSILTNIGRKELEEFGISNLSTSLNKFQLGKRKVVAKTQQNGLWSLVQQSKTLLLKHGEEDLFTNKFLPWFNCDVPKCSGIYVVKHKDRLIYIGESSNIYERYTTHSKTTYFSALRRHIGTELLNYKLKEKQGKKRYFSAAEDESVSEFLRETSAIFYPVNIGRYELEEYLIKLHKPILNIKGNL
jgi:predicted GIY-YIG superfamily endonuclease